MQPSLETSLQPYFLYFEVILKEATIMVNSMSFLLLLSLLAFAPLCLCNLNPQFYDNSCPQAQQIAKSILTSYFVIQPGYAAQILRLHFHDCFVMGCDGSLLLDSSESIVSEKESDPNRDSARGFIVIDAIKLAIERACPSTVSCADILTIAARDSVVLTGGPSWEVPLGRRDSRDASISGSNNNIPAPNSIFPTLQTKFEQQGLNLTDLVTLSGAHTLGVARCTNFRQRLYNQSGNGQPDPTLDQNYAAFLRVTCTRTLGDQNPFFLDYATPLKCDNSYFKNLMENKGLLNSDQILFTMNQESAELVRLYAERNDLFFEQFSKSMIKMGNISPLTNSSGEIRQNCRRVNA
ncbi:hypothetical protein GYH30_045003 [Glycine max]|nr:hypothetical protein GYH30_045003 [Glycine max]